MPSLHSQILCLMEEIIQCQLKVICSSTQHYSVNVYRGFHDSHVPRNNYEGVPLQESLVSNIPRFGGIFFLFGNFIFLL